MIIMVALGVGVFLGFNIEWYSLEKNTSEIYEATHFSDLLRLELLIKYGGTWVDASVLITNYTKESFNKDLFFFP